MAVTYTTNLKLGLPVSGTELGTWGDIVNQQVTTPVEQAISGTVTLTSMTNADYTLANGTGVATNEARYMAFTVPATLTLTAARNIIVPSTSKMYLVTNSSTGGFDVTVKTAAGSGVSVLNGRTTVLYCDGSNVIDAAGTVSLTTGVTGTLPVANGGTGVTTSTGTGATVLSTSPTLTTPILGTPQSATLTNATGLPLTTGVTGTLPVGNGGTGATTLALNNVLLGNGTSALQVVAPDTSGNILTSNGTTWVSAVPVPGVPTGAINMWPTDTAPTGWLLADGSDVSRTVYASLFAVVGTTFGSGSGSTFTLPNYTNRMPIGSGGSYALAATGGSANAVVVSHTHTGTSTVTDPAHAHSTTAGAFVLNGAGGVDSAGGSGFISGASTSTTTASAATGISVATSISTEGSSSTNANLPPYLGIRFIIKT